MLVLGALPSLTHAECNNPGDYIMLDFNTSLVRANLGGSLIFCDSLRVLEPLLGLNAQLSEHRVAQCHSSHSKLFNFFLGLRHHLWLRTEAQRTLLRETHKARPIAAAVADDEYG